MYDKQKVINIALAEEGYREKANNAMLDDKAGNAGSGNYTKYARDLDALGDFYNGKKQGFAYCDVFVDWCFVKAYGAEAAKKLLCQPDKSCGAGCYFSAMYYRQHGRFQTSAPQPGDQIFFTYSPGEVSHTGLVYGVNGETVLTIEGNTGDGVFRRAYPLNDRRIYGYGRPDYGADAAPSEAASASAPESGPEYGYSVKLGLLKRGAKGAQVKTVQRLLIAMGISCGAAGADGDFGPGTENAVKKFQQLYALEDDGEVGGETWGRLLRG